MASHYKKRKTEGAKNGPSKNIDKVLPDRYLEFVDGEASMLIPSPVDIYESKNNIYVDIELPGMEEKKISVTLEKDKLTIDGYKPEPKTPRKCTFHCAERGFGNFRRTIVLGYVVDSDKVEATYKNGILHITVPKRAERRKTVHDIKVKSDE